MSADFPSDMRMKLHFIVPGQRGEGRRLIAAIDLETGKTLQLVIAADLVPELIIHHIYDFKIAGIWHPGSADLLDVQEAPVFVEPDTAELKSAEIISFRPPAPNL